MVFKADKAVSIQYLMLKNAFLKYFIMLLLAGLAISCSPYKHLSEGEKLYEGSTVKWDKESCPERKQRNNLEHELEEVLIPEPNKKFLGLFYMRLWFHNIAGEPTGRGLRYFLKNRMGEPPVLISDVHRDRRLRLVKNRLDNNGYFIHQVNDELHEKDKSAKLTYHISTEAPYKIGNIFWFDTAGTVIQTEIAQMKDESLLKTGNRYELNQVIKERNRIESELRDIGYYYFSADNLIFKADSSAGNRTVNLSLHIKPDVPQRNLNKYIINNVFIEITSTDRTTPTGNETEWDTIEPRIFYKDPDGLYQSNLLADIITIRPDSTFNRSAQTTMYRQIMDLGVFQFVQIQFRESGPGKLDMTIIGSNLPKRSLTAELMAVTKSNNYSGPVLNLGLVNRNLFSGAENYFTDVKFGFETQFGSEVSGMHAYDLSVETGVRIPKLFPFGNSLRSQQSWTIPKTTISIGYQLLNRVQFFHMQSYNFKFSYFIPQNRYIWHEIAPIQIKYIRIGNTTEAFDEELEGNPFLQRSFEEQFIAGLSYGFFLNTQRLEERSLNHYFNLNLETAGNALSGVSSLQGQKLGEQEILGNYFSQFAKADFDYRAYWQPNSRRENKLVTRLFTGIGLPYGNSEFLPYAYQYFAGGSNSIRAFRTRGLGPGSYAGGDDISFFDRTGDIKLEGNIEYRFPIISIFKGAIFIDAGNIWQWQHADIDDSKTFNTDRFLDEIAIGTGVGLRLDVSFFVLRLDLGFPLRNPMLEPGERWVISDINPGSSDWRRNSLMLNLALGYPF